MTADLSPPARRMLSKLAASRGVVPVSDKLGAELVRAGYASRIGEGYAVTAAGVAAATVQSPTDSAERETTSRSPVAEEPTEPLF